MEIKGYQLGNCSRNITLQISLPMNMLKDLQSLAEYQGQDIRVDIRRRLARTLEKDIAENIAYNALNLI